MEFRYATFYLSDGTVIPKADADISYQKGNWIVAKYKDSEDVYKRQPTTSVVAVQNGRIIGNILCGHDGRTGCFYHVCVANGYRKHGIGYRMVRAAMEALQREGVSKISLIAFKENQVGNAFWKGIGWVERGDINLSLIHIFCCAPSGVRTVV